MNAINGLCTERVTAIVSNILWLAGCLCAGSGYLYSRAALVAVICMTDKSPQEVYAARGLGL